MPRPVARLAPAPDRCPVLSRDWLPLRTDAPSCRVIGSRFELNARRTWQTYHGSTELQTQVTRT
eukprot:589348-Prorocentrum_minimum.AAC.2